ncbi:YceI family protein [Sandarakinorhabdus oryzae]|uniref:YceI family protein n=1 Tax=Sandarakinorhabdus oryzae TaxID=2675220 RepID=UPI0012E2BAA8|nr:YceI family protein [Sandarakinorhabdus oryzae]
MFRTFSLVAALALGSLSLPALAQPAPLTQEPAQVQSGTYVLDPAHGKITWSVNHLGFSTYVGQFPAVSATLTLDAKRPEASRLVATVDITRIASLNAALDKHLATADFFESAKFPTARFEATGIRLTGSKTAEITGQLTLRGVTRPITMTARFNQAGTNPLDKQYSLGFDGDARIKRSDFGVNYGVPFVSDEVTLHLEAEFKRQLPATAAASPAR